MYCGSDIPTYKEAEPQWVNALDFHLEANNNNMNNQDVQATYTYKIP